MSDTEGMKPAVDETGLIAFNTNGRIGLAKPGQMDVSSVFITTGPGDYGPVWSPQGDRIAFTRFYPVDARGTYVMAANGSGQVKVADTTNAFILPTWSPDGSEIAVIDHDVARSGIWVAKADGSENRPVFVAKYPIQHLAWSPSGDTLAFTYNEQPRSGGLYFIHPAQVTTPIGSGAESEYIVIESDINYLTRAGALAWSPDGRYLAVRSRPMAPRGVETPEVDANKDILSVVQVNGDGSTTILHRVTGMAPGAWSPIWAPNSETVAVVMGRDDGTTQQLAVVSLTSGLAYTLYNAWSFGSPTWSPDGGMLVAPILQGPDNAAGRLTSIGLADIGMDWVMSMDMTHDMKRGTIADLLPGRQAAWSPTATAPLSSIAPVEAALSAGTTRIASFTFKGFT
ncbi:MAG: hypothetical protein O3B84_05665 [Chloroflexi bacterium]|nr:hypothetical protein [Chloroflexota bacterium]